MQIDLMKENFAALKKERSTLYPASTLYPDVDYTDDQALIANTPA